MYKAREKIFWFAIVSRFSILLLQMIFNVLCPDHNADAFRTPNDPTEIHSFTDNIVTVLLRGLTRWDAQYFIHIAKYGYTYENTLAFFPLFPMSIKYVVKFLQIERLIQIESLTINHSSAILIVGVVINFVCFIKAALVLYDLSQLVFKDTKVAYRASILFCINPASIFFTALYTESMFAYLTFYSMLESLNNNVFVFLPLSLSSLVRSNGLVNIGFPAFIWFRNLIVTTIPNYLLENKHYHSNKISLLFNFRHIFISLIRFISTIILCLLPFGYFQIYNYANFCKSEANTTNFPYHVLKHAQDNNFLIAGRDDFSWCNFKIPIAYSYIQNKYWNVGFMKYYEFKQIPNFVLAFPVLYFMVKCIVEYVKEHKSKFSTEEFFTGILRKEKSDKGRYPLEMFVFIVHASFLTLFCIFFVHIQVSTRLLCSASPVLYWYCALVTLQEDKTSKKVIEIEYECPENLCSKWKVFFMSQKEFSQNEIFIYRYFIVYFVIGCFMYANFLPWT